MNDKKQGRVLRNNKHARHNYEIKDTIEAGIVLAGHEVKSLKTTKGSLKEAIVTFKNRELWLVNCTIPLYNKSPYKTVKGYESKQDRKLLITKRQMARLRERTRKTGLTLLPLEIRENKRGLIKCVIGLGKLMKKVEKREKIKEKDTKRMMDRQIKDYLK